MNKESLIKAREILIFALNDSNIEQTDKVELMLNINKILSPEEYDKNIKILKVVKK